MPGKNGKKGFLKLTNEEVAVMGHQGEESGSEIELLDVSEIDHYGRDIERKSSRGRGCCCDCCIAFYLFLLTIAVLFLTLFILGTGYYVQILKKQVSDMDSTVHQLKTDLTNLQHKHDDQTTKHTSHLNKLNISLLSLKSSVTGLTSSVTSLTSKIQQMSRELKNVSTQLNKTQMEAFFNQSMTKVMSFSKEVNEIHTSMAHLNSIVESLNNKVTETKEYCSDFGTKIETISTKTSEANDAVKVIKSDNKARNKYVDLKLLKLTYFKGNTTQKLHQMEWVLKTSPEKLINTFMNRTSPSEDHLNEIIDLRQKLTELRETMDFVLEKLTNLTEVTPTVQVAPPTKPTVKVTPITDKTTPSSSKSPDSAPKHSSTSATEDHPKTDVGTIATPTRPPNTTTSANKPHPTDSANKTINTQTNITALDNENNETTPPTENKTTPTGNSTYMATPTSNTTEAPTTSTQRAEQALKNILDSFDENDLNHNGSLSLEEFRQIYNNSNIFDILDENDDDGITKAELTRLLKTIQDKEHEPTTTTAQPPNPPDEIDVGDNNTEDNELTPNDENGLIPNDENGLPSNDDGEPVDKS